MSSIINDTRHPMSTTTARTGQQYSIRFGGYEAVVTELGATLRRFDYQGKHVIVPVDADDVVPCCNGYVLVPFPNRLEDGTYTFEGRTYELPIDEHERRTAIHGFGYRHMWKLVTLSESSVTLEWRVPNIAAYPFDVIVQVSYELGDDGLTMRTVSYNNGSCRAPWAFGIHPWLSNGRDGHGNDEIEADNALCRLTLPCDTHVVASPDRLLPTGEEPVDGSIYDLRDDPTLESRPFDDAWTGVRRDDDGNATAIFTRPDGLRVFLTGDDNINAWQVCTATGFPEDQHPAGVAIEPMTAYANAFRSGLNLLVLEPGAEHTTVIRYRVECRG